MGKKFSLDGGTCDICGTAERSELSRHHIVPVHATRLFHKMGMMMPYIPYRIRALCYGCHLEVERKYLKHPAFNSIMDMETYISDICDKEKLNTFLDIYKSLLSVYFTIYYDVKDAMLKMM